MEQNSRRKRSIFDAAPRGPLKAKMPERCGMPLAQMFISWCEQSKPGDKLFLGVAHMDRHARASLGMLRGATSSTSLLSPSAGVLQGLSLGTRGGPGHQAGKVLCAQEVTAVGNIFCMNN